MRSLAVPTSVEMRPVKGSALDYEKSTISCQVGGDPVLFFRKSFSSADASRGGGATRALAPRQENGSEMARQPIEIA
jgi:hypothetical protein